MADEELYRRLSAAALEARKLAYCPYSHFAVGAALAGADGNIYTGCNIENAAFTPTICAERTAFFKAVSGGCRNFSAIAIAGGSADDVTDGDGALPDECPPCGVCRQVMMEFCDPETFVIVLARSGDQYRTCLLREILPLGFGPGNLKKL